MWWNMTIAEKGITFKLFTGFPVNSELRMHLKLSKTWKEHQIIQKKTPDDLQLVHFNDKDYLGYYLEPSLISMQDISALEKKIRTAFEDFFPKYQSDALSLYFFAQAFIS